jgi:hypothetical protein
MSRMSNSIPLVLIGSSLFAIQAAKYFSSDYDNQATMYSGSGGSTHHWYGGGGSFWHSSSHYGGSGSSSSSSFHSGGFGSSGHAAGS